jgi:uncharacterized protein YgfB (UPF0149 family)
MSGMLCDDTQAGMEQPQWQRLVHNMYNCNGFMSLVTKVRHLNSELSKLLLTLVNNHQVLNWLQHTDALNNLVNHTVTCKI